MSHFVVVKDIQQQREISTNLNSYVNHTRKVKKEL